MIFLSLECISLYISYILNQWSENLNTDFTLGNCLFGSVEY